MNGGGYYSYPPRITCGAVHLGSAAPPQVGSKKVVHCVNTIFEKEDDE
jgi:hypothetical protein